MSTLNELFTSIANAIRNKKKTTKKIKASDFANEISTIETGIDTSDATATAEDIAIDKTAYVNSEKVTGTVEVVDTLQANGTSIEEDTNGYCYDFIGTTSKDRVLVESQGTVKVKIPKFGVRNIFGIIANKIKAGDEIAGVAGTFTKDGTATAEDIAEGKIAYVNGEKIVGTASGSSGEYNAIIDGNGLATNTQNNDSANILCQLVTEIPTINTSGWKSTAYLYSQCRLIEEFPKIETENVEVMEGMYSSCYNLKIPPSIDTSKVKNMKYKFTNCKNMITASQMDTQNTTTIQLMYNNCAKLITVFQMNASAMINVSSAFTGCSSLENFGGLKDLGKAYTQKTNNYSNYKLGLSACLNLTHDSLMNVINNLYDLNLTYDVANGGTLYTQSLQLGSTNLAKLTDEEKAIAQAKGFTLS